MTQKKNSPPRSGLVPLITGRPLTRRDALTLGLGSVAAGVLPFGWAEAAAAASTSRAGGARAGALRHLGSFHRRLP
jgi:hypothetical protein